MRSSLPLSYVSMYSVSYHNLPSDLLTQRRQKMGQFVHSLEGQFSVQGGSLACAADTGLFGTSLEQLSPGTSSQEAGKGNKDAIYPASHERLISTIRNLGSRQASPSRGETGKSRARTRTRTRTRTRSTKTGNDTDASYDDDAATEGDATEGDEYSESERKRLPRTRIPLLEKDISVTMRHRATEGYGLDPVKNRRLVRDNAREGPSAGSNAGAEQLWSWMEHAATMSSGGRAYVDGYDFGFRGVLPILRGFSAYPSHTSQSSQHASTGRPATSGSQSAFHSRRSRTVSQPKTGGSSGAIVEDVKHSIHKGDSLRAQEAAYSRACASMNRKNGSAAFPTISGASGRPAQRQLALSCIGPDFASGDVAAVIRRYESNGKASKAAAWALFSGNIELAIKSLKNNKGETILSEAVKLADEMRQMNA